MDIGFYGIYDNPLFIKRERVECNIFFTKKKDLFFIIVFSTFAQQYNTNIYQFKQLQQYLWL